MLVELFFETAKLEITPQTRERMTSHVDVAVAVAVGVVGVVVVVGCWLLLLLLLLSVFVVVVFWLLRCFCCDVFVVVIQFRTGSRTATDRQPLKRILRLECIY
jgi:fatty acid desaturase